MLSTDKPVYQPGQMIHLRALALETQGEAGDALAVLRQTVELARPEGAALMKTNDNRHLPAAGALIIL